MLYIWHNRFGQCGNKLRGDHVNDPYLLSLNDETECIVKVSCGDRHTLLLINKNNIYSFGWNKYNQCTISVKDECISSPYLLIQITL